MGRIGQKIANNSKIFRNDYSLSQSDQNLSEDKGAGCHLS